MSSTIIDTLKNAITNLFNWQNTQEEQHNNVQADNNKPQQQIQPQVKIHSQPHQLPTNDKLVPSLSLKPSSTAKLDKTNHKSTNSVINYIKNYLIDEQVQCMICLEKFRKPGVVKFCLCEHQCCRVCLNQYINAKLNHFLMPKCPQEECTANINKQTVFFKSLNQKTKLLFDKVEKFYFISNDPFLKMCPNENCNGIIPVIEDQPYQCLQCQNQFCKKCMYPKHKGKCTKNQALILNMKYSFTKCRKCGIIVQKTEACDHMTCKCGYQFCYRCGRKWVGAHHCKPPVKKRKDSANNGSGSKTSDICWEITCSLFLILFFPFIFLFWIMLLLIVLLSGLISGITFYSIVVIIEACKKQSPALAFLLIILFPAAMMYGVYTAFNQYWGETFMQTIRMPC